MDAPVPLIVAALLAASVVVGPSVRGRALGMLGALVVTPVILLAHVWDTSALHDLRDHPPVLAVAVVGALTLVVAGAVAFDRRPGWFPLAAVAAVPFRVPIAVGGSTSNLLVPLYAVVGAGALAYLVPRLRDPERAEPEPRAPGGLEWALAASVVLYALQSTYSSDVDKALENTVFFLIPFTLLFVLLGRVRWSQALALRCLGVLVALAGVLVAIGFVEYATKHLLLNPKVIASNQFEDFFRVNSLFFDPNIYGRFLMVVMLGVAAAVLWTPRPRDAWIGGAVLAVLWAGLVVTFSQSSFVALLVGLAVLGALRVSVRGALAVSGALVAVAVAFVLVAPHAIRLDTSSSKSTDSATSGRYDLVKGGLDLFADAPIVGHGSGSFAREYRRREEASDQRATSASHTIPITVAAEQGLPGLALYLVVLVLACGRLFRGARRQVARAAVAAAFVALVVHTMLYAAFLEDPLTWTLLGAGVGLARIRPPRDPARARRVVPPEGGTVAASRA